MDSENGARTSAEWWAGVKADPERLRHWLRRQYVGEMSAVGLLSELLVRFGSEADMRDWQTVHRIMLQEATHALWLRELLGARRIDLEPDAEAHGRYWAEVLPNIRSFAEGVAAGYHAENMRLERIRVICTDEDPHVADIRQVFQRILPQEEFHERAFDEMRRGREMTRYHEDGLRALNLVLA